MRPALPEPPGIPPGACVPGAGLDLVDAAMLADQLDVPGTVFAERAFSARERREARRRCQDTGSSQAEHLAARWAAKEAFVKAWSQALARRARAAGAPGGPVIAAEELDWQQIEMVTDRWGRPRLHLSGQVAQAVEDSLGPGSAQAECWPVSVTHETGWAAAIVLFQHP